MKLKQKIRNSILGAVLLVPALFIGTLLTVDLTYAAGNNGCETDTAIISCDNVNVDGEGVENTGLWSLLITTINIMTAGVGILAVAGFLYGGYLYITSGGSPEQVKKAKTVFTNIVIGVIAFGGMFALLNFLVPGGVFN